MNGKSGQPADADRPLGGPSSNTHRGRGTWGGRTASLWAAFGWSVLIFILALVLPVVSVQQTPVTAPSPPTTSSSASGGPSPTQPTPFGPAPPAFAAKRVTLVREDGYWVLLLAALPAVCCALVYALLRRSIIRQSKAAARWAWYTAIGVLASGLIGFVTIIIGAAIIPVGALLIVACSLSPPPSSYKR